MTHQQVVERVQAAVADYRRDWPAFPDVQVPIEGVREDQDWFYVAIARLPPYTEMRAFEYYDHLNAIENVLREKSDLKVLLVPARAAA